MRVMDIHTIPCKGVEGDELRVGMASGPVAFGMSGLLELEIANKESEEITRTCTHYLDHASARELFALLGQYLHTYREG